MLVIFYTLIILMVIGSAFAFGVWHGITLEMERRAGLKQLVETQDELLKELKNNLNTKQTVIEKQENMINNIEQYRRNLNKKTKYGKKEKDV